jgi:hypothetical protein
MSMTLRHTILSRVCERAPDRRRSTKVAQFTEAAACSRDTLSRASSSAATMPSTGSLGGYWHQTCGLDTACRQYNKVKVWAWV